MNRLSGGASNGLSLPDRVRKADACGRLCFQGNSFRIGKAFCRESIGIREKIEDGCYSLWWYGSRIARIDMKDHFIRIGKEENPG
jgi:hypothetical protein